METQKAIFAAGCFWGVQYFFDRIPGVVKTTAGYTGGHTKNPTYDEVCTHKTGHAEAVLVEFDPKKTSFITLLKRFFFMHDPTQLNKQGADVGNQYRSAIFYFNQEQRKEAIEIRNAAQKKIGKPVLTQIELAGPFYEAEEYHQKFTEKTGIGVCEGTDLGIAGRRRRRKVV